MTMSDHLAIGWQLFKREFIAFKQVVRSGAIDATVMTAYGVLTFGFFMPAMGVPQQYAMPLFVGSLITSVLFFGYHTGSIICQDLVRAKVWQYHVMLPIPLWVMIVVQTAALMMRIIAFVVPAGVFGILLINQPAYLSINPLGLLVMTLLVSLFFSLFFVWAVMFFPADHYYQDLWPCVLAPMYCFGCLFFPLKALAAVRPTIAKILLLNPMTHCIEGLRACLFDATKSIPLSWAIAALVGACVVVGYFCKRAVVARLNPAQPVRGSA